MTKDRSGIKSILSIHTPRRVEVAKKPRPTVQEMLSQEDQMNIYDPLWYLPDTPEVLLKPQEPPKKEKKERTDKIYKHRLAMQWLTRPKDKLTPGEKKKIIDNHYKYEPWANKKVERIIKPTEDEKENKDFWAGYNDPSGKKMVSHINNMNKKYAVIPQTPERKQKARVNNTTREKPDGQV